MNRFAIMNRTTNTIRLFTASDNNRFNEFVSAYAVAHKGDDMHLYSPDGERKAAIKSPEKSS